MPKTGSIHASCYLEDASISIEADVTHYKANMNWGGLPSPSETSVEPDMIVWEDHPDPERVGEELTHEEYEEHEDKIWDAIHEAL